MATDFWSSSHYKRWLVDRAALKQSRAEDLLFVDDPQYLDYFPIYFANIITKLGKKLGLRQRVIATATVFFRRFYLKNSYCETDPFIVISACCYVAAKAEESPVQIKSIIAESRSIFAQENYNVKSFPTENTKIAEMEFYLVDDLECDLVVFHPYRTLLALCKAGSTGEDDSVEAEAGEVGIGIGVEDGPRYWGTGEGKLEMSPGALQTAWFIINDTYRSDLCLIYPPHLIAVAAIYLTLVLHAPTRSTLMAHLPSSSTEEDALQPLQTPLHQSHHQAQQQSIPQAQPRRSSRQAQQIPSNTSTPDASSTFINHNGQNINSINNNRKSSSSSSTTSAPVSAGPQDPVSFLADLNVSLPLIATISQEIISLYTLWDRYKEDMAPENPRARGVGIGSSGNTGNSTTTGFTQLTSSKKRINLGNSRAGGLAGVGAGGGSHGHVALGVPANVGSAGASIMVGGSGRSAYQDEHVLASSGAGGGTLDSARVITPALLTSVLYKMREAKYSDTVMAGGRPVPINKMLERTQAAG